MTRLVQLVLLAALIVSALPGVAQARVYDPRTGRWVTRDPMGYVDGQNRYQYARANPVANVDPSGLASVNTCMDECVDGCPQVMIRPPSHWKDPGTMGPDPACVTRCETLCQKDCPSDSCRPTGAVTWSGPLTTGGISGVEVAATLTGEDPTCCSKFAVVQFVRRTHWPYGPEPWVIDDGRLGLFSDPSPWAPFYDKPVPVRQNGRAVFKIVDDPGSWVYNVLWEFADVAVCAEGPARGHRYGCFGWYIGTSGLGGNPWQPAGALSCNGLPDILIP